MVALTEMPTCSQAPGSPGYSAAKGHTVSPQPVLVFLPGSGCQDKPPCVLGVLKTTMGLSGLL